METMTVEINLYSKEKLDTMGGAALFVFEVILGWREHYC